MNCQHAQTFNRMFSAADGPLLTPDEIDTLSCAMFGLSTEKDAQTNNLKNLTNNNNDAAIPAGYTYFFQFISHDIVPDTRPNSFSRQASPMLNLDSLYGTGENGFNPLLFNADGTFKHHNSQDFDVWREPAPARENDFRAFIPEPRNDENVIVVQIHRLWQKLHDVLVGKLQSAGMAEVTQLIQTAQQYTIAIFHHVLIYDALPRLIMPEVYKYFFEDFKPFYFSEDRPFTGIPVEFSHAAFRFGHSMLRPAYAINWLNSVRLEKLLRNSPMNYLTANEQINWRFFFDCKGSKTADNALEIDVFITPDMHQVFRNTGIARLNLLAGENAHLASMQTVINEILSKRHYKQFSGIFSHELKKDRLTTTSNSYETDFIYERLAETIKQNRTPLWLCILHENLTDSPKNRAKLGLIGSAIISDVLRSSILENYKDENIQSISDAFTTFKSIRDLALEKLGCAAETVTMCSVIYPK